MAQRSVQRVVFRSIQFIAFATAVFFGYRAYKADSFHGLIEFFIPVSLGLLMQLPMHQGKKLAIENMKKYGLEPDRDEGPARP